MEYIHQLIQIFGVTAICFLGLFFAITPIALALSYLEQARRLAKAERRLANMNARLWRIEENNQ